MNIVVLVLSLDSIITFVIISSTDDKMEAIIIPSNLVPHDLSYIHLSTLGRYHVVYTRCIGRIHFLSNHLCRKIKLLRQHPLQMWDWGQQKDKIE